jgi:hypothetical protein
MGLEQPKNRRSGEANNIGRSEEEKFKNETTKKGLTIIIA